MSNHKESTNMTDTSSISSWESEDDGITSIKTPDEILFEGLLLAGFDKATQKRQPKSNTADFISRYGSSPLVLAKVWEDLQTTPYEVAWVPPDKRKLEWFFVANHFLKQYPTELERKAAYNKLSLRRETIREWTWYFCEKIEALKVQKIVWPDSHIAGDDIWVGTVDGTMFSSNEIAGKETVKDRANFSFKHHCAGFNAEVVVSLWESRVLWINGPGPAGKDVDLVLFRKEGGLREKLLSIGKKVIADGGYAGERETISTPNGHDEASVRKFKSRAQKRHEKFNNMLKCFKCLSVKFRHTAWQPDEDAKLRYKVCFGATAVLCQYQMENGQPLYNVFTGNM